MYQGLCMLSSRALRRKQPLRKSLVYLHYRCFGFRIIDEFITRSQNWRSAYSSLILRRILMLVAYFVLKSYRWSSSPPLEELNITLDDLLAMKQNDLRRFERLFLVQRRTRKSYEIWAILPLGNFEVETKWAFICYQPLQSDQEMASDRLLLSMKRIWNVLKRRGSWISEYQHLHSN